MKGPTLTCLLRTSQSRATSLSRPDCTRQTALLLWLPLVALASACAPAERAPAATATRTVPASAEPTVLDVEAYRPQLPLKSCKVAKLESDTRPVSPALREALVAAQAYSDSAGGLSLLVLRDGRVVHERYNPPAGPRSQTASASMMKSVLGLVTGIAVEKGLIGSTGDALDGYLPEWRSDPRGKITIGQLLTMSSGLAPSDFAAVVRARDTAEVALATPLAQKPGEAFNYNNIVSVLIGTIIDRRARGAGYGGFAGFMQREFWCPIGNEDASLWADPAGRPRFYAGLHATGRDWARIGELLRKGGRAGGRQIVPPAWIARMMAPSSANPRYGYQLWLGGSWQPERLYSVHNPIRAKQSAPFLAGDTVFFDGFGGQRVYVVPSRGLAIVRTGFTALAYDDAPIVNGIVAALD